MLGAIEISQSFRRDSPVTLYEGDCLDLLSTMPDECVQLVVTSPPYNIGKEYESRVDLQSYLEQQGRVIAECVRVLRADGSLCWQVGNYVQDGEIIPLDSLLYPIFAGLSLKMRNRIVWHFGHGLHCRNRFSGRYKTIVWYTKADDYFFDLNPVRVPQKYPGKKHFKGPRAGEYSCDPRGKNPGDVWDMPNVKSNHVEKTVHPCQFPVGLVERLVLSMTREGDAVLDPFAGVGTTLVAAVRCGRTGHGAEVIHEYVAIARERIRAAADGRLRVRPMNKPVYDPGDVVGKARTSSLFDEQL